MPAKTRPQDADAAPARDQRADDAGFPIVGVGASAGGLEAFTQLLTVLPPDTGVAFVLVLNEWHFAHEAGPRQR